jgi:acyl carrier protein
MPTKDEIYKKVQTALVDALGVDEDEVTPTATLVGTLGADLSPEDILTNASYVQDGKVTPAGIAELKKRMPFADFSAFEANPQIRDFSNLITVSALCKYIESKVGA